MDAILTPPHLGTSHPSPTNHHRSLANNFPPFPKSRFASRMKTRYRWTDFVQKWWCITSIIVCNKQKSWWYPLVILNKSKKLQNLHNNIFEFKVHFELELIFIQRLNEEDWIKLMYTTYITYSFLTAIGPHVCDSWNITKQKKIEKIMQCPFIKSPPLWYGSGFFLKKDIMHSLLNKCKTTHFLNGISSKIKKFPIFNWCISIPYIVKNSPNNSIHNPSFEVYIQNFKLYDKYYFVTNIFHMFKFFNVCWIFQNNLLDEV